MRLFIFLALLGGCLAEKKNLPSRGDISIYLIEDGESSGTEIYLAQKSPDGNPTRVVLRSDNQHVADEPLITLEAGGRTLPVFKEKDGEDSIYVVYTIKKGPSRVDLTSAILEAFGAKSKSFMDIVIDGENQQWLDVALEALIKLQVKAETAKISTFKRKVVVTEAVIHKLIKSAQLQKLNIGEVQIPELSSGFFLSPRVRDLVSIDVAGAEKNDIDDKALGALKATRLRLGSAPLLTLQGLRHFVQPAFEQGIREIGIQNPNFVVEPNILFKGLKVKHEQKKESPPFTTQTWDLEGKYGKFVFETKTNANGYVAYQAGPR